MDPTVGNLVSAATQRLQGSASARLDAELLLAEVIGCGRAALYRDRDRPVEGALVARFDTLIAARSEGRPVAYLLGHAEFWSLTLTVSPAVLVPRPETELLVEIALACCAPHARSTVVDVGTGSGAIACAFAHERGDARVIATDRSAAALAVARSNAERLGLSRIHTVMADWLEPFADASLDAVLANPPYIGSAESHTLDAGLAFEPRAALFAGYDGLAALARIIPAARRVLRAGGWLVLEHGYRQGPAVRELCRRHGFGDCISTRDLAGHERVTRATG